MAGPGHSAPTGGGGTPKAGPSGSLSLAGFGEFWSLVGVMLGMLAFVCIAPIFMTSDLAATLGKGIPLVLITIAFPYFLFMRTRGPLNERALLYPGRWLMLLGLGAWCIWWPAQLFSKFSENYWGGQMADYWNQSMMLSAVVFLLVNLCYHRKSFWITGH